MAKPRLYQYFVGDFETTVYDGQTDTAVWASGLCELHTENAHIFHSLPETWSWIKRQRTNMIIYYHNLKFDGSFWLDMLLKDPKLKPATIPTGMEENDYKFAAPWEMENNTYTYSVNDMGQWYTIKIMINHVMIEIRDSLKLLPFSVKELGKAFKTKHQKLDMEYKGYRYPGCTITPEERKYLANDLYVVKEALEVMFAEGYNRLTIGSCALSEYKASVGKEQYAEWFPNLYNIEIPKEELGFSTVGDYIHKSYKGGWCYLVKGKENHLYGNANSERIVGTTADVNSLYPSMMSSESGNYYPVGEPTFWTGNGIPKEAYENHRYFFVRIKTRFYLKTNYLPFIQIKGSWLYKGNECLESSDVFYNGQYYSTYTDFDGNECDTRVTLVLTMSDYDLLKQHYDLVDFEILDGCWFETKIGIFDKYIEKYRKMKMENEGAIRTIAKLFLNSLYGKFSSSLNSSFKSAYVKEDGALSFMLHEQYDKEPGYIAVGSAITSYSRCFTIRAAQANFYGANKRGFIYADTDSIHCDLMPEEIKGIKVDKAAFCCWKLESCWNAGIFVRQKTYMEHITMENLKPIDNPYYNVKCAGMPQRCKDLLIYSMTGLDHWRDRVDKESVLKDMDFDHRSFLEKLNEEQLAFLDKKRTMTDFCIGLKVPGKLTPKRIPGGILLTEGFYEMLP